MPHHIHHLVVDSGGFIKNAPVKDLGENVYTIREVVTEIRDKPTRQRLQVLPYTLHFKEPTTESIRIITEFSKKTGDYRSLSAVDIKLMALSYQLEKQHIGIDHIRSEPISKSTWTTTHRPLEKSTNIAGFYLGKDSDTSKIVDKDSDASKVVDKSEKMDEGDGTAEQGHSEVTMCTDQEVPGETILESEIGEEESDEEEDDDDDDDDDEGWITPNNIASVKKSMGHVDMEETQVQVGCLTTDFAMQNVLIQMGLNVVSVDGMLIRKAKSYVQRCSACQKTTSDMEKAFCAFCGNHTLQRIAKSIDDEGNIVYCLSRRKACNVRGLKHSLPAPQGGKYASNPILCADQPLPDQRLSRKALKKNNVFADDYIAQNSPFATTDTHSRSAQLGFGGRKSRHNPNERRKNYGRRK